MLRHKAAAQVQAFFLIRKVYSPPASADSSRSLPVCLANAWKSFTEPGSVARIFSVWPAPISCKNFLVRRIGRGQLRPRASRSEEHTSELQSRLHLVCRLL